MPERRMLLTGLTFGELPRRRDGRLRVSAFGAREVIAVDAQGAVWYADVPGKRRARVAEGASTRVGWR